MFALLIPFALIAGVVMYATRAPASAHAAPRQLAAVSGRAPSRAPSPIAVLCVFLRSNRRPPPIVIQCAIAEAQLIGRDDLAYNLMRTFGDDLRPTGPRALPTGSPTKAAAQAQDNAGDAVAAAFTQEAPMDPPRTFDLSDLSLPGDDVVEESLPVSRDQDGRPSGSLIEAGLLALGEMARAGASEDLAPARAAVPSPIPGVDGAAWSKFAAQLVRESPAFNSQRNVGRYRHRKDRLAEVGFDPDSIVNSSDAQDAAFNADLADAYRHLVASGTLGKVIGRPIAIPDVEGTVAATLSGVLGLASVAGLEGAMEWLQKKGDRKKFPHTTLAFMRTNGVF